MIKYFGLAIFACTCFLGGYITGQWTTFNNPAFKSAVRQQLAFFQQANEINDFGRSAETLKLIKSINPANYAQIEAVYTDQVKQNIKTLEAMKADGSLKPYGIFIEAQLRLAKSSMGLNDGS